MTTKRKMTIAKQRMVANRPKLHDRTDRIIAQWTCAAVFVILFIINLT